MEIRAAAKHHGKGDRAKGSQHSEMAHSHSEKAHGIFKEARSRMKRFILVDRKRSRVCCDTAAVGWHAPIWTTIAAHLENVPVLSASAARLVDQSLGKAAEDYIFTPFAADQDSEGYLVFICSREEAFYPPMASESLSSNEAVTSATTSCKYVGYVRRAY